MSKVSDNNSVAAEKDVARGAADKSHAPEKKDKLWRRAYRGWKKTWLYRRYKDVENFVENTWAYRKYQQINDYKFFPKFMAARGGITAMVAGSFMLAGVLVTSISAMAIALTATGVGLLAFGIYGTLNFGGGLIKDGYRKVFNKAAKAPPDQETAAPALKKMKRKVLAPAKIVQKTSLWQRAKSSPFAERVAESKGYRMFKEMTIWKHLNYIGKDQEVRLRTYATSGSVATILSAGTILATQTVALPVLTFSLATMLVLGAVAGVIGGTIALVSHSAHLVRSLGNAVRESIHNHRQEKIFKQQLAKMPDLPARAPVDEPEMIHTTSECSESFEKATKQSATAGNDNKGLTKTEPKKPVAKSVKTKKPTQK